MGYYLGDKMSKDEHQKPDFSETVYRSDRLLISILVTLIQAAIFIIVLQITNLNIIITVIVSLIVAVLIKLGTKRIKY